jgi:hypothetical protein
VTLNIGRNGIAFRQNDGTVEILLPGRQGGSCRQISVSPHLSEAFRLAPGDIVEGEIEAIPTDTSAVMPISASDRQPAWDEQLDEQTHRSGVTPPERRSTHPQTHRLVSIRAVNGLPVRLPSHQSPAVLTQEGEPGLSSSEHDFSADGEVSGVAADPSVEVRTAEERPFPRAQRARSERTPPDRRLMLATGRSDVTGRTLDFAAPLGAGVLGIVYGSHGAGLTRTLQSVLDGIVTNAPDCVPLVLLLRARAEEATEWRRRFPEAEIVVGASAFAETEPEQILQLCDLMLESAQRQTELGRDVVLLVDSLTALWGTMLEAEEADAQREADTSLARRRMREWVQKAGCFHGEAPLGGGLGGSLTLLGTVWHQAVDAEAEEEHDLHPHLRLLEHILPEAAWLVPLSDTLARQRLYPTIDVRRCRSQYEDRLLAPEARETHLRVRGLLPDRDPGACYLRLQSALDASADPEGLLQALG